MSRGAFGGLLWVLVLGGLSIWFMIKMGALR